AGRQPSTNWRSYWLWIALMSNSSTAAGCVVWCSLRQRLSANASLIRVIRGLSSTGDAVDGFIRHGGSTRVTGPPVAGASPEGSRPSTFAAATRCPVLPIPGRSRFDVYESDRQAFLCVDPSDSRPCGFPLDDGGETR